VRTPRKGERCSSFSTEAGIAPPTRHRPPPRSPRRRPRRRLQSPAPPDPYASSTAMRRGSSAWIRKPSRRSNSSRSPSASSPSVVGRDRARVSS